MTNNSKSQKILWIKIISYDWEIMLPGEFDRCLAMIILEKDPSEFLQNLMYEVQVVVDVEEVLWYDLQDLAHEQSYDLQQQHYFGVLDAVQHLRMIVDVAWSS